MPKDSVRIDLLLVERGFFDSRAKAHQAIEAGGVVADGRVIRKASERVARNAVVQAEAPYPWVSRGGVKLAHGLAHFEIDARDAFALDVGASTGGFTDVLLSQGAQHVSAVDVGHGQFHPRLAGDARVRLHEGRDARGLTPEDLPRPVDLVVMDVSFISIALLLPHVLPLAAERAALVALIKPQFEVGKDHIGKGGIVRDEAARDAVCQRIVEQVSGLGWRVLGVTPSPITGGDGNCEFLIGARRG